MAYVDINTPVIDQIQLPSGTKYYIADRELRNTFQNIMAAGIEYIIAWDGITAPDVTKIPDGLIVSYSGTSYTGTFDANNAKSGAFYLVKSSSLPSSQVLDIYQEYISIGEANSKTWEKLGDTKLNLTDTVTDVALNKQTNTVIGANSTFTVTQPTISLTTDSTSGTGKVQVATGVNSATVSKSNTEEVLKGLGSPATANVIGANSTFTITQPTIAVTLADSSSADKQQVVTNVTANKNTITAIATNGSVASSGDLVNAITGYANPTTDTFVKTINPTSKKLETTSITGVSGSVTASKATADTSQTTAIGTSTSSTNNSDLLKGVSVNNNTLIIGAATLNTQTTTQYTFNNVTVPIAASATTVATGGLVTSGSGGSVITAVANGTTASALTALGTPSTDSVLGADSEFTVTQPTITIREAQGAETGYPVATDVTVTKKYLGATASGANTDWNNKNQQTVVTGYTPTTTTVLGEDTTISVTPTTTYIKGSASGANIAWDSKDSTTVLNNNTSITVTKGS